MKKLILFNMMTVDGLFEGPGKEIDWHNVDSEFNEFAIAQLDEAASLVFGRITYELMASYWPMPYAIENDSVVAEKMNNIPKIVFSRTLGEATWNNTLLLKTDPAEAIPELKKNSPATAGNLFLFGSANLAAALIEKGLVDEFRIMLNPIVLGNGNALFKSSAGQLPLKLLKTRVFDSGNILLYYQPQYRQ